MLARFVDNYKHTDPYTHVESVLSRFEDESGTEYAAYKPYFDLEKGDWVELVYVGNGFDVFPFFEGAPSPGDLRF